MYYQDKFGAKESAFQKISWKLSHFGYMSPCCDHDLKNSKPIFVHVLRLIMMHYNTKFGSKMFNGLEDNIWKNIDTLTLYCNFDLECTNPFFQRHSGL